MSPISGSAGAPESPESAGLRYLELTHDLIGRLMGDEWPNIRAGAELIATAVRDGRAIHVFGSGHSHILAEELFYRAGGLVHVQPILFEGLMLHASAPLSTSLERLPGLADAILLDHPVIGGDVLIVASNSGSNLVASELVQRVQAAGAGVVAITSLRHATSAVARASTQPRLHELANVVIDNGGLVGDAAIDIAGFDRKVAPTSTVIGAAIVNAMVAEAVEVLVGLGIAPDVYTSSNVEGGDDANAGFARAVASR